MNVTIAANTAEIREALANETDMKITTLQRELDGIFRHKINTPEQVIFAYNKLKEYETLSGKKYKITFEENTIV
jgi:hypothetical protein